MAKNCIINCILSHPVSLSQVKAPPHRGNEGENDDPPTRPNVFFFFLLSLYMPLLCFSLLSAKMQDSLARMTENRGCGCWNPSCAFSSKHRVRCQPTAMHKTTVKKIKINKQKNDIAIFSVPVSLQLCLKQQNKVSSIKPRDFYSILFIKIKHRDSLSINITCTYVLWQ